MSDLIICDGGDSYILQREQWNGNIARISKDQELLEKVKKFTWTYTSGKHPYLNNSVTRKSLHRFVMDYIYGTDNVQKMIDQKCIIEHLDNDGLNCTFENLHIVSGDMNKAKAFSIDKISIENESINDIPPYVLDVYYLHKKKLFQMQIFMNDDILSFHDGKAVEILYCLYDSFEDLFIDWFYLLNQKKNRTFDYRTFHAKNVKAQDRPYIPISKEEKDNQIVIRDGVEYLNLDATINGKPAGFMSHTALRDLDETTKI